MILICFCSNPQKRVPAAFSGKHQSTDIVIFYSHNSYFEVMNHGKSNYALLVLNSLRKKSHSFLKRSLTLTKVKY